MLHKEKVSADTLGPIKTLLADPLLNQFYLVGGTGLVLQLGHRESLDIDFYCRIRNTNGNCNLNK